MPQTPALALPNLRLRASAALLAAALAGCQTPETTAPQDDGALGVAAAVTPGLHTLKAVHSGKCLEIADGSSANGAKLRQAACNGSQRQQWHVKSHTGGVWEIRSAVSGKCADVSEWSTANLALIQQWDCNPNGQANQRWMLTEPVAGQYRIQSVHSRRCVDVGAWSTADGATILQWDCHGGGNQRFVFTPVSSDGGGGGGGGTTACKRGVAYGHHSQADLAVLSKGVSWWYNWSPRPDSKVASTYPSSGVEFVPMIWDEQNIDANLAAIPAGAKYLLAFNEPNFHHQANITPREAAALWPKLETAAKAKNLKIVSPATNFCGGACNQTNPYQWLRDFFAACPNCQVDYIASHWYACDGPALNYNLGELKKFGKPIWLTEFSCLDAADKSVAVQQRYMTEALNILENDPMVFRYSWFIGRWNDVPSINLLGADGQLTPLGQQYVSHPQSCKP